MTITVAGFFAILATPITTLLLILTAEVGGRSRGVLSGMLSCSNWAGMAMGAAAGGLVVAHFGFAALAYLLCSSIVLSGILMMAGVTGQNLSRARAHFA